MLSIGLRNAALPQLRITLKRISTIEIGCSANVVNKHTYKLPIQLLLYGCDHHFKYPSTIFPSIQRCQYDICLIHLSIEIPLLVVDYETTITIEYVLFV